MKLNFKTLLIIFLIALLGAGIGTVGVMEVYKNADSNKTQNDPITISTVDYNNKQENSFTQAIDKAYNTVVEINCTIETTYSSGYFFFGGGMTQQSVASGSGVIVSEDGYIVTNNHVVEYVIDAEDAVKVKLYNGDTYNAKIIGTDAKTDLAVLKIDAEGLQFSSFADSAELVLGEDVIAIGNPLGLGLSCSNGIVSALEKEIYINNVYLTVIQTNAAVNEGNSGGGLFDLSGNIVGIVNAKKSANLSETTVEGMGYAIPANTVKKILSEIVENGYVKDRAALGIRVYTDSSSYKSEGVIVADVTKGGSADQAGIQANDIITAVSGIKVESYADLSKVLDSKNVGDQIIVTITRGEKQMDITVTLQQSVAN